MRFTDEEKASLRALFGKSKDSGSKGSVAVKERTSPSELRGEEPIKRNLVFLDLEDPIVADAFYLGTGVDIE